MLNCVCEEEEMEEAELSELAVDVSRAALLVWVVDEVIGEEDAEGEEEVIDVEVIIDDEVFDAEAEVVVLALAEEELLPSRGFFCRSRWRSFTLYSKVEWGTPK